MNKYVYIKKNNKQQFVEFSEPLTEEYFSNIGKTWEDYLDNKWILLNEDQLNFHMVNPTASVKEVWDMHLNPKPERTLDQAKQEKIFAIDEYDHSNAVNSFTLGNLTLWLTVNERQQLASQIDANDAAGRENMTRYFGGQSYTFTINVWRQMLTTLEVYAGDAINITELHKAEVSSLNTIKDVDDYDITIGYPKKIHFNIE